MAPKKATEVKTEAKKPADTKNISDKPVAEKAVESVKEVKAAPKAAAKKPAAAKKTAGKTTEKKATAAKKPAQKKAAEVIIQSALGGEITPEMILAKIGNDVDKVYVRVDQNKAFWVRGEEAGDVDLW